MSEISLEEAKERDYWLEREREFMHETYCEEFGEQGKITPVVQDLSKTEEVK